MVISYILFVKFHGKNDWKPLHDHVISKIIKRHLIKGLNCTWFHKCSNRRLNLQSWCRGPRLPIISPGPPCEKKSEPPLKLQNTVRQSHSLTSRSLPVCMDQTNISKVSRAPAHTMSPLWSIVRHSHRHSPLIVSQSAWTRQISQKYLELQHTLCLHCDL